MNNSVHLVNNTSPYNTTRHVVHKTQFLSQNYQQAFATQQTLTDQHGNPFIHRSDLT